MPDPYPIDTTPSNVATSALQSIPFGSLIGGPLNAAVQAQAQAAKTTVDFINDVCMNKDSNGNKSAITVVFTYQDGYGFMRTLTVPLITILPIPYIAVTDISIDFKANISASSATSTSSSESSETAGSGSAKVKVGWGLFSAEAQFNASYSSKKDSKATQDSKYSVEYTMDVSVKAGSADMPGGLSRVLNILADGITMKTGPRPGTLTATAPVTLTPNTAVNATVSVSTPDGTDLPDTITPNFSVLSDPAGVVSLGTAAPVPGTPGQFTIPLTQGANAIAGTTYKVQVTAGWTDTVHGTVTSMGTVDVTAG